MLCRVASHPAWVCGLKLVDVLEYGHLWSHTLRGCVDWNPEYRWIQYSHPRHTLRGCVDWNTPPCGGLKKVTSHPAWVCGLKHIATGLNYTLLCHTLRGCVDWNISSPHESKNSIRHTLRGCVDWNRFIWVKSYSPASHTLRGCVDWNDSSLVKCLCGNCHTLRGCVDWNHAW